MNSFIGEIKKYNSLSIVGLEKNTGKTVCLNYILNRLPSTDYSVAVTSIGIDGETKDAVTSTVKPEIVLKEGTYFSTSEAFYNRKSVLSELREITNERSSLGRIVTAKVLREGKVLLSGPSSSQGLSRWVDGMKKYNVDLTIVDGALSRLSSASPIISESLILTTGAAYSADMSTLVKRTKYIVELVELEKAEDSVIEKFIDKEKGVWGIDSNGDIIDFKVESSLAVEKNKDYITGRASVMYVGGALTDRFVNILLSSKKCAGLELVVRDFTKIFVSELTLKSFIKKGGVVKVLRRSKLIAVCVNPVAPNGIVLDSDRLCGVLASELKVPVYDLVKNKNLA